MVKEIKSKEEGLFTFTGTVLKLVFLLHYTSSAVLRQSSPENNGKGRRLSISIFIYIKLLNSTKTLKQREAVNLKIFSSTICKLVIRKKACLQSKL